MDYLLNFGMILGGLILLVLGGDLIVRGAVGIATRIKVPTLVIGLTIVAIGTSAPEIVVSIQAALANHPDIAMGNIIGSNISNILLVLGISAIIYPISINSLIISRDTPFLIGLTMFFILMCATNTVISRNEGIGLVILLVIYLSYTIISAKAAKMSKKEIEEIKHEIEDEVPKDKNVYMDIFFIAVSIPTLAYGADILVVGASNLALSVGISESVIGLTIVAIGSSAPELAACVVAATQKHPDIVVGNIVGSNLLNILAGISSAAIITPIRVEQTFIDYDNWVMLGATIVFAIIIMFAKKISRAVGILFASAYLFYITSKFLVW